MMNAFLTLGLASLLLLTTQDRTTKSETLLEIAAGTEDLTTLVAALEAVGL
ncbi:hypothetical protein Poly30_02050 [Planctomycetes bacterium Poly30]|uniref:Uncharacterized protein n=1 Tax=Saltatorellus ferox TaxID=2528018 RepID=A0A518EKV5_9BACT|nr:hypothetical protein Poly30_02050 [Planctomycetes bacterium Poly30]